MTTEWQQNDTWQHDTKHNGTFQQDNYEQNATHLNDTFFWSGDTYQKDSTRIIGIMRHIKMTTEWQQNDTWQDTKHNGTFQN